MRVGRSWVGIPLESCEIFRPWPAPVLSWDCYGPDGKAWTRQCASSTSWMRLSGGRSNHLTRGQHRVNDEGKRGLRPCQVVANRNGPPWHHQLSSSPSSCVKKMVFASQCCSSLDAFGMTSVSAFLPLSLPGAVSVKLSTPMSTQWDWWGGGGKQNGGLLWGGGVGGTLILSGSAT